MDENGESYVGGATKLYDNRIAADWPAGRPLGRPPADRLAVGHLSLWSRYRCRCSSFLESVAVHFTSSLNHFIAHNFFLSFPFVSFRFVFFSAIQFSQSFFEATFFPSFFIILTTTEKKKYLLSNSETWCWLIGSEKKIPHSLRKKTQHY